MKRRHQNSSEKDAVFSATGAKSCADQSFESMDEGLLSERKQSREILSVTNAAVQALSSARGTRDERKPILKEKLPASDFSKPFNGYQESNSMSETSDSICTDQREVLNLPDNSSSSSQNDGQQRVDGSFILEDSFNGVQRVRVPSRLLREINSPLERSGNTGNQAQQPTPVIIRHVGAPISWVSMATSSPVQSSPSQGHVIRTHAEPTSSTTIYSHVVTQARDVIGPVREKRTAKFQSVPVHPPHVQEEGVSGNGEISAGFQHPQTLRKTRNPDTAVLCQGDPVTGMLTSSERQPDCIKVKSFSLNERERSLKEEFMKSHRQDRKSAPIKRTVQPTLVTPQEAQASGQGTQGSHAESAAADNLVVSAAAIAAAAASAATAPFFQLQHGLESQIGALVSTLQVLQTNQDRTQQQDRQEQEKQLQDQIDTRLKRLEEIQKQMLELQSLQLNSRSTQPTIAQNMQHVSQPMHPYPHQPHTTQAPHPTGAYPSKAKEPMPSHDAFVPLPPHPLAAQVQYPTIAHPSMPREHVVYRAPPEQFTAATHQSTQQTGHSLVHGGGSEILERTNQGNRTASADKSKYKIVKNTKTQTSPQESFYSRDSPLQTPLPRKRPPVPISRSDLPRSQPRHPALGLERRVHFDVEPWPRVPAYSGRDADRSKLSLVMRHEVLLRVNSDKRCIVETAT